MASGRRNGVVALAPPRLTAGESSDSEPRAADYTVDLERLRCVRGAARVVPTRGRAAGTSMLVEADGCDHRTCPPAHGRLGTRGESRPTRRRRLGEVASPHHQDRPEDELVSPRVIDSPSGGKRRTAIETRSRRVVISEPTASGRTTTRYPAGTSSPPAARSEHATRNCRRRRLRMTAPPTFREMANATAGRRTPGRVILTTVSGPLRERSASRPNRRKTARSWIRSIKQTDGVGPCGGGPSRWPDRRGRTCGDGNRASWHDVVRSADRYASLELQAAMSRSIIHSFWFRESCTHVDDAGGPTRRGRRLSLTGRRRHECSPRTTPASRCPRAERTRMDAPGRPGTGKDRSSGPHPPTTHRRAGPEVRPASHRSLAPGPSESLLSEAHQTTAKLSTECGRTCGSLRGSLSINRCAQGSLEGDGASGSRRNTGLGDDSEPLGPAGQ